MVKDLAEMGSEDRGGPYTPTALPPCGETTRFANRKIPPSRLLALLASLLVLPCCARGGGGSPTAPSAAQGSLAAGTTLTFVSGETQQPAAGATVRVGADAYTTGARGEIQLGRDAAIGAALTIESGAYLTRATHVRDPQEWSFSLWPRASAAVGLDEGFTRELVYSGNSRLNRLPLTAQRLSIVPSAELLANPVVFEACVNAAERMTAVTAGQIQVVVEDRYSSDIPVTVEIGPPGCGTPNLLACTDTHYDRYGYIFGAQIYIQYLGFNQRAMTSLLLHELGHVFGLNHVSEGDVFRDDVMNPALLGRSTDYSAREQLSMRLMLQRRAGNRFPDDDALLNPAVLGLNRSAVSHRLISCGSGR